MSLNPFVDTNQVVVEILDGLRGENIQKPFDSELILIQDIIKGQSNDYLGNSRPDIADMMPIVEETFEEGGKEAEDLSFEVKLSLHVPLELEYAFLDGVEHVLDDDLAVCSIAGETEVLCEDSDEDQNSFLGFVVIYLS